MERYRIVEGVGVYYVTFTVVEWLPVFIDETACQIVTNSFNFCITNKHLRVNAYVIMPTHLHAIAFDSEFNPERLKHALDDMPKLGAVLHETPLQAGRGSMTPPGVLTAGLPSIMMAWNVIALSKAWACTM